MIDVRAFAAAALSVLALVAAGCGTSVSGVARGADLGTDAAALVPPDATAFVAVDTDLESSQWQRVDDLTKSLPVRTKLLDRIQTELQKHGLTWKDDVAPALGSELDIAAFGTAPANVEYVAFAKPDDEGKLRALASKLSEGADRYTVEKIAGWSVVADSQELFDRVRSAQTGTSLSKVDAFRSAWSSVTGDALARAYVSGEGAASLLSKAGRTLGAAPDWLGARVAADGDALRVEMTRHPVGTVAATAPVLLRDVPSGASLAVAFHGLGNLLAQLPSTPLGTTLRPPQLAPLLSGEGVLYVRAAGVLPEVALELTPKNPRASLVSARRLLRVLAGSLGPLPLTAQLSGGKLVIADGPAAVAGLRGGAKLVDDADYKDALKTAGVPAKTTFLAYADVAELAPFVQLVVQAIGGQAPDPALVDNLSHVDKALAWGSQQTGVSRISVWLRPR
jgi:hypothetical protein